MQLYECCISERESIITGKFRLIFYLILEKVEVASVNIKVADVTAPIEGKIHFVVR